MEFLKKHPAEQLSAMMLRVYDRGLTTATGGNISILDDNGDIWITPKGIDKGGLTAADIVCVHPDGTIEGKHAPSSELPFHQAAYRARPDFRAVLHAHPLYCIAYSLTRTLPRVDLLPEIEQFCRKQSMSKYAMTGSQQLAENLYASFAEGADVVFLENHGVCVGGQNLLAAYHVFESIEYAAKLELLAKKLGAPRGISQSQCALATCDLSQANQRNRSSNEEEADLRRALLAMIHRAHTQKLFSGAQGVCSVRLNEDSFLISPAGLDNAELSEDDLSRVSCGTLQAEQTPARLSALHAAIYTSQPEVNAIFSAQPINAMAFAVTDAVFETYTIPESYLMLREVPKFAFEEPYVAPQTAASRLSSRTPVVLFENNCLVTTGDSLFQAFDRLEVAEATAGSLLIAREAGQIVFLNETEIYDLKTKFHIE